MTTPANSAAQTQAKKRTILSEEESKLLLKGSGVRVTETVLATSKTRAVTLASDVGYPVVLKVASPDITHKTDVGGVRLNLGTSAAVRRAYDEIMASVKAKAPTARIQGVTVQPMAPPGGVEVIVGMSRDPQFGPVLMFGLGGVAVEILQDVSFRIVPLLRRDAREMIREIKGYKMLTGFRNLPAVDLGALEDLLLRVSELAEKTPGLAEMDLNPVMAYANGAIAVDARVILEEN